MTVERVLVTGGAGFIGSHLAERLLGMGRRVIVVDDLSTGSAENVASILDRLEFTMVQGSVTDPLVMDELVGACDVVVHLAAAVGVKLIMREPLRSFRTNVRGTEVVLDAADRHGKLAFIASTSEIYGRNADVLTEDSDRLVGPPSVTRWAYSSAKAVDEFLAFAHYRERGVPIVIGRFFNTVGPRQSAAYGMVIPRLVRQALRSEPLTVYGDGTQRRCFCHVRDAVEAVVRLVEEPDAVGEAFNIGATEEVSIKELAERIVAATVGSGEVQYVPYEIAHPEPGFEDIPRRRPDTSKIEKLVGWRPTRDLDTILDEVIAFERARMKRAPGQGKAGT